MVATSFKFEWKMDSGEIGGEEDRANDIDINEIMKIKEQSEKYLLDVDEDDKVKSNLL